MMGQQGAQVPSWCYLCVCEDVPERDVCSDVWRKEGSHQCAWGIIQSTKNKKQNKVELVFHLFM